MSVQRISAFSMEGQGGNPAGVLISDKLPEAPEMAAIARSVGFSETAFAAPDADGWRVRYFSPESEVPFCGHATIALGSALGARFGAGRFDLALNEAQISVNAELNASGEWSAALMSPPTETQTLSGELREGVLEVFGVDANALDPDMPMVRASAGADMVIIPLKARERLARLDYDLARGKALLDAHGIIGAYFVHRAAERKFNVRMAFPTGGVFEDPATGAAAAALSGWLRDSGRLSGEIEIRQGEDMGASSRLIAFADETPGAPVRVQGETRRM